MSCSPGAVSEEERQTQVPATLPADWADVRGKSAMSLSSSTVWAAKRVCGSHTAVPGSPPSSPFSPCFTQRGAARPRKPPFCKLTPFRHRRWGAREGGRGGRRGERGALLLSPPGFVLSARASPKQRLLRRAAEARSRPSWCSQTRPRSPPRRLRAASELLRANQSNSFSSLFFLSSSSEPG